MMYNSALQASGGSSHYNWSVVNGAVPDGLQLEKTSGIISGVPRTSGTADFTVAVVDAEKGDSSKPVPVSLTVVPQLAVSNTTMPTMSVGSTFMKAVVASGGQAPYSWSAPTGSLPPGIVGRDGIFLGVPTTGGTYKVTYQVSDSGSPKQVISVPLVFQVAAPLSAAANAAQKLITGTPFSMALSAAGGTPAYSWTVIGGSLPAGLSLSSAGTIAGTPTAAGSYSATLAVRDQNLPFPSASNTSVAFTVIPALQLAAPALAAGTVGTPWSASFVAGGGTPGYVWSTAGTLPAGISLSSSGVLAGTPTTAGTWSFAVQLADNGSPAQTKTAAVTITVANPAQTAQNTSAGTSWYVRKDGGTRYSSQRPNGQCDGKSDLPYLGIGVNQHCAFNDVRYLWQDGEYDNGSNQGWVIAGGDTVIVRGSIADGVSYRIGWNNKNSSLDNGIYWGKPGDPYGSGMPIPPSGTAAQPTRILGGNYGSCHVQSQRTQLHGGYAVYSILNLQGAKYVDVECLDLTDFSSCGRAGQVNSCNNNLGSQDDFASNGILLSNTTGHITMTDVRVHGTAGAGMYGAVGDGNTFNYLELVGNPSSGWNADNGTVGSGSTLVQNFNISWNGCAEQYPMTTALPYGDCTDDNGGGYGDGFGTASINSTAPWNLSFDTGVVSYNTQDGLDALHLVGAGSTMTINRVLAYGNMGQQIKIGGAGGTATNNVVVTSCNAMRNAIPGTPDGYNSKLSDFCRAADSGIHLSVQDNSTTRFDYNTVYSASATAVEIGCGDGATCQAGTDVIDFRDNIILGFKNSALNGYVNGGTDDYSNPIYVATNTFKNKGSVYDHNVTFHPKSVWTCPNNTMLGETNALCADPGLLDESWHVYGTGIMSPVPGVSLVLGAGVPVTGITTSMNGQTRTATPTIGAYE